MGLFDKLLGRKNLVESVTSTDLAKTNQEMILRDQSSIEKAIAERKNSIRLDQCLKVSFGDVTALGTTFSQMIPALRTITTTGTGYLPVNMAAGDVLKTAGEGLFYGSHVTSAGTSVMTKWAQTGMSSTMMPINCIIRMLFTESDFMAMLFPNTSKLSLNAIRGSES